MTTLPILEWSALAIAFLLEMGFFWSLLEKQKELENLKAVLHKKRHDLGMREVDYITKYSALKRLLQEIVPQQLEVVKETGLPLLKLRVEAHNVIDSKALMVRMSYDGVETGIPWWTIGIDRRLMMLREEINLAERLAPDLLRQMFAAIEQHKRDQERESVPIEWQTQEEFRRDYPPPQEESHNAKGVPDATPSGGKEKSLDTT